MQQLELFTDKKLGFKYRKRLYNDNQNYMYTAIPIEEGYKLVPVSIYLKGEQLFYLTTDRELTEVIPKDVEARL